MTLTAGARLGPYEIVAPIGSGGMGEVYRARDPRLKRDVAVKVLARAGADPARQRRLLDEAQAASALNHPNIITVYDVGTADGVPFVVSEFIEGASLRALASRAPLPVREVLDLTGADLNDVRPEFWVLPLGNGTPYVAPPPVADLPGVAAAFSWLPDSRRVLSALSRPRPGTHVWMMDTERSAPRLLTATGGVENDPAVSPDGTSVALALQQVDYDLYQLSVEHPSPVAVLVTSRNEMDPAWSSTATAMAFTTDRSGREEIWLRSEKGDFERPLATPRDFGASETYLLGSPAISPNGQQVAYNRIGAEGYGIWITALAGGPPVALAPAGGYQDLPSWSPDGAWIAYLSTQSAKGGGWLPGTVTLAKMRVGARTPPEIVASDVAFLSQVQWSPDAAWIAYNSRGGLSVVSPDGKSTRVLHEQRWMGFAWSADSQRVYGIRQSDDFKHLTFSSIDLRSGAERVLGADVMPLPVAFQPVSGFTRVSPTTFLASIAHVRSDVWLLEGFDARRSLRDRLGALLSWSR